jgi:hypothetical protein
MMRQRTSASKSLLSASLITNAVFGPPILLNLRPHAYRMSQRA